MESQKAEKSKGRKTLEATVMSAVAGLIIGGVVGFSTAAANSDFGSDEAIIAITSAVIGCPCAISNKSTFGFAVDYFLGVGAANVFYRIGYYGSRALYETLR